MLRFRTKTRHTIATTTRRKAGDDKELPLLSFFLAGGGGNIRRRRSILLPYLYSSTRSMMTRKRNCWWFLVIILVLLSFSMKNFKSTFQFAASSQEEWPLKHTNNQEEILVEDEILREVQKKELRSSNNTEEIESHASPTSNMANQMLRSKGVLLHYDERQFLGHERFKPYSQQNETKNYVPATFIHASMQASNPSFRGWPEEGEGWVEEGPRIFYLIGSKFEPEAPPTVSYHDDQKVVDCRAYYPYDAGSGDRNHHIKDNPLGTSCSKSQNMELQDLYNTTNGCSCNYNLLPGKKFAEYFIKNPSLIFHRSLCWYPGSDEGIRNLIDASNSLFHNRRRLFGRKSVPPGKYWGWTECSGSPNIQEPSMIDALIISLPLTSKRSNFDNSYFEDLDEKMTEKLKMILNRFVHLNLPVLLLQEKKGDDSKDCHLLWGGLNCKESFSKRFMSKELEFEDGSCLARVTGDEEVRFYPTGSSNCTVYKLLHQHNPLWEMYRLKSSEKNGESNDSGLKYDQNNDTESLVLLLTGDIHGNFFPQISCEENREKISKCVSSYGAPYLSRVLKKIRSVEKHVVLVDAGDAFFGMPEGGSPEMIKLIADTMNFLQYDVMALGNHEPDYGADVLHKVKSMLQFPIIASNVEGQEVEALGIKSHINIPIGKNGQHLCIIGVTAREVYPFVKNLTATPEVQSVFQTLKTLDASCNRRVILSHAGIDIDRMFVNKFASLRSEIPIDAILGGHSHISVSSNENDSAASIAKRTPLLLHTHANGQNVGLLRLVWNTTSNLLLDAQSEILPLDEVHGVYRDNDANITNLVSRKQVIDRTLQKQRRPKERIIEIIGKEHDDEFHECGESCRFGDCVLGQIITDAMRFCVENGHCINGSNHAKENQDPVVIALLESGTIRSCFDPNNQLFDDILPWPNKLVTLRTTGDNIVKMLQHGISTKESSTRGGGFLQISGLQYNFTEDNQLIQESICLHNNISRNNVALVAGGNNSSVEVVRSSACKKSLKREETYMLVVTDWLAAGGDGFGDLIEKATVMNESKTTLAEAVSLYRKSNVELKYSTSSQYSRSFLVTGFQSSSSKNRSTNGVSGFVGGAISYILTYPLHSLFVKKAAQSQSSTKYSWKLFNGVLLGLFATSLTNGIYFKIYGLKQLVQYPNWARSFVAAISNSVITTPFWVIITWQQTRNREDTSIIANAREICKVRGMIGFFDSLPFDCILCIYPIVREVTYEMILQNNIVTSARQGYLSAGTAGMISSMMATIITYPIQKLRIVWHLSPHTATNEMGDGFRSITTCKTTLGYYARFFSGIGYKLAETCTRSFFLFYTMEFIDDVLKNKTTIS